MIFDSTSMGDTASLILEWFKRAMPHPTDKNRCVQLGCHYEEVAETAEAAGDVITAEAMKEIATTYKTTMHVKDYASVSDELEFLDGLVDTIVTSIGTAYTRGYDVIGALRAVNANNWSKFVDGQPVFDENGKIAKPPGYKKVDLRPYLNRPE